MEEKAINNEECKNLVATDLLSTIKTSSFMPSIFNWLISAIISSWLRRVCKGATVGGQRVLLCFKFCSFICLGTRTVPRKSVAIVQGEDCLKADAVAHACSVGLGGLGNELLNACERCILSAMNWMPLGMLCAVSAATQATLSPPPQPVAPTSGKNIRGGQMRHRMEPAERLPPVGLILEVELAAPMAETKETDPVARPRRVLKERGMLVMYNRIPKTGSASLLAGIKAAAGAAGRGPFRWHGHSYNGRYHLDQAVENRSSILTFCGHLAELARPGAYALHTTYLECPSLPVAYINQVRDPIDRFVSKALFFQNCVCNPPKHGGKWCAARRADLNPIKAKFCGMDLNDLAAFTLEDAASGSAPVPGNATDPTPTAAESSIRNVVNVYTAYFCGAGTLAPVACTNANSPEALSLAKYTLEHKFRWVGILEEPDISRRVLEHRLPTFFGREVYKGAERVAHPGDAHFANGTLARSSDQNAVVALSGTVHDLVQATLANDYALYQFARELIKTRADLLERG